MSARARTAVRWLGLVGGIARVVLLASGIYVTFRYRPDAAGADLAMVRLHRWSSFVLGVAGLVIIFLLMPRRRARLWFALACFLVAWIFAIATGRPLAWDQVGLREVSVGHDVRGIFFRHHAAVFVRVDGHEYSWEHFRNLFWLHAAVFPLAMGLAFALAMVWARRLRRQPDVKSSADTPAAILR